MKKERILSAIAIAIFVLGIAVNVPMGIKIFTNCPIVEEPEDTINPDYVETEVEEATEVAFNPVIQVAVIEEQKKNSVIQNVEQDIVAESCEESTEEVTEVEEETEEVEETKPTVTPSKKHKFTSQDREALAKAIYCEAGSTSEKSMLYTGSVILNRLNSSKYPSKSVRAVVEQRGQYGISGYYLKRKASKKAYQVADKLIKNGSYLPSDYFGQAGYKTFAKYGNKKRYKKVGKIYFFAIK